MIRTGGMHVFISLGVSEKSRQLVEVIRRKRERNAGLKNGSVTGFVLASLLPLLIDRAAMNIVEPTKQQLDDLVKPFLASGARLSRR